jgi:carbonyl reductase 1
VSCSIGLEIVRLLGKIPGMRVIGTSRDPEKGSAAAELLSKDGISATYAVLDITSQASVDAFAKYYRATFGDALDILVNNAGIAFKGDVFGPSEAKVTFETNFHGTVRMTDAMLPFLKNSKSPELPRIVNVCSMAGRLSQVSPELQVQFQDPKATPESIGALLDSFVAGIADGSYAAKGWPKSMYGVSKLAEIAYTYVLVRDLKADNIVVNACCPGYCSTSMSSFKGHRPPEQGAETPVWLATRPGKIADITGGFYQDKALLAW